jgi:HEAT repeat protein
MMCVGDHEVLRMLRQGFRDERAQAAADLAGSATSGEVIDALIEALGDDEWVVRSAAARTLGKAGDTRAIPALKSVLLRDDWPNPEVLRALTELGEDGYWPPTRFRRQGSPTLGALVAWSCEAASTEGLIEMLRSDDWRNRLAAARCVGQRKARVAASALLDRLDDSDSSVRGRAAESLGLIGDDRAEGPLIRMVEEDRGPSRTSAAIALGRLRSRAAVLILCDVLMAESFSFALGVTWALGEIGDPSAVGAIAEFQRAGDQVPIPTVVRAFVALGACDIGPLTALLADPTPVVRAVAAEALELLANVDVAPQLIEGLRDRDADVRRESAIALGRIGDTVALSALESCESADSDPEVRQAASEAARLVRARQA